LLLTSAHAKDIEFKNIIKKQNKVQNKELEIKKIKKG